jgi:uncharacterized phage protein gp47/JayE
MPFPIPALSDLVLRARQAFRTYLPGSDAWLFPNNLGPTAKVFGGLIFEVFGFADYIQKQKFALTADGDNLELHGAECKPPLQRKPAQPATGNIVVTTQAALTAGAAAQFQRADGMLLVARQSASIAGAGILTIAVEAASGGQNTTTIADTALTIFSGVTGAGAATATIAVDRNGLTGGLDIEPDGEPYSSDLATFRGRILFNKRNPPFGGNPADYVQWCTSVIGVTRVFVERLWNGPGTVRVFPLMDDLYGGAGGVPAAADLQRVIDYLQTVQPSDALVTVQAPVPVIVNVTVQGLEPSTTATQEAVLAELAATFRRKGRIAGNDNYFPSMPYLAHPTTFALDWIAGAINNAAGVHRAKVILPNADIPQGSGQIPVLGTVTFM